MVTALPYANAVRPRVPGECFFIDWQQAPVALKALHGLGIPQTAEASLDRLRTHPKLSDQDR